MKRIIAAIGLLCILLTACAPKETLPDPNTGMYLTQTTRVGKCSDEAVEGFDAFEPFFKASENFVILPGITQNFLPKAIAQNKGNGYFYVAGYFLYKELNPFSQDYNPAALAVMDADGKFIAEYVLKDPSGNPFVSDVAGLAIGNNTLFISAPKQKAESGEETYWIGAVSLDKINHQGHNELTLDTLYQVPVNPSILHFSNNTLWVGNFYRESDSYYAAPANIGTVKGPNDKKDFGAYLFGYDLSAGNDALRTYSKPDEGKVYAIPETVQGVTFLADGKIVLNQSYGLQNNSQLMIMDPTKGTDAEITLFGEKTSCKILEVKTAQVKSITMMPLSTDVCADEKDPSKVYVIFDSASPVYDGSMGSNVGVFRTDYLWSVNLNS